MIDSMNRTYGKFRCLLPALICVENVRIGHSRIWRRGRDLNPRGGFKPPTRLAGERLRPLGHLSMGGISRHVYVIRSGFQG